MVVEYTKVHKYDEQSPRKLLKHYKLIVPSSQIAHNTPIVYIHGGAWVGESHTYNELGPLIDKLDSRLNNGPYTTGKQLTEIQFFVLDYRLSPEVVHPHHILDVLHALSFVYKLGIHKVSLVGHSAGSTMCTQILEYKTFLGFYDIEFTLPVPDIDSIVFLDGIFDISKMLEEYPSYLQEFVQIAFPSEQDWSEKCNMLHYKMTGDKKREIRDKFNSLRKTIIAHSTKDELLSTRQPTEFCKWLDQLPYTGYNYIVQDMGTHNETYKSDGLVSIIIQHLLH
ncbi:hypothetical protein KL905_002577 [Ogataea polymorpha]|uniref:BD-FAE-like domain-containing protein n=1 Tax=Ogataea polymorpha TaxID=460523 RepID=A0A9P8SZW1_9ASCO|nr:hypothetical protein KL907_002321 [Ogataea polymorpha]KAG7909928.1 hypothetical protein KL906_001833 [Ogataea polymorpha]KAG7917628.1 hypothetical protein KL927_002371 [Ogataea polymorpha]KAG7921812.1 hypothetical protein KL905_002577 [Ogataea polymorpha]KAH3660826.1 hypothetical protein OGATHE_005158 [Ogataea polymorpha]